MVKNGEENGGEERNIFRENPRHTKTYIGRLGERIAARYLRERGFSVTEMNYRKKWGEIDVIVEKDRIIHFVEVKTVSRDFSKNSSGKGWYRPEDNIHPHKLKRIYKAINSYLIEQGREDDIEWQLDLVSVYLDIASKQAKVDYLENIA